MEIANPTSQFQGRDSSPESSPESRPTSRKHDPKSEREKRTYRACLHCRQRKSRCDLYSSGEPGKPPCERCIREQHECILGGSRRGGRRIRRNTADPGAPGTSTPIHATNSNNNAARPGPLSNSRLDQVDTNLGRQRLPSWNTLNPESRTLPPVGQDGSGTPTAKMTVDDRVASTDLQNPADALEFLAHVAERDSGRESVSNQLPPMQTMYGRSPYPMSSINTIMNESPRPANFANPSNIIDYPPLVTGLMTLEIIHTLLLRYEDKYHPFFPIASLAVLDPQNLKESASKEPHLLAAILTVASKDEKDWWQIHQHASEHMQSLVGSLAYSGIGTVEAVEGMLILAEWVPRSTRLRSSSIIGRGEEDQAAWMYVGTAIRLGYLLGIDRTGFRAESDANSPDLNRKRLAWASCYICDRQISVRIGKAFWSRGPGPMMALRAQDFPSLQSRIHRQDNLAAIFQANLELTQLFSNAHDVLYATKSSSNHLSVSGSYPKHLDDFRVSLRHWNEMWGVFTCSQPLKASLVLSYEYLRLYVNAFAYQATLNRLISQVQAASANGQTVRTPAYPFADVAATPDARFIYDAIDAAKALLTTFCSFVDPTETFRYMPLRYYLYVIYSAVFLYKARSTGVMGGDSRGSVKSLINNTIDNLAKSSACANDVGDRYSKLIRLLWRKPPGRGGRNSIVDPGDPDNGIQSGSIPVNGSGAGELTDPMDMQRSSINAFSWLDLGAVGDFAVENNTSVSGSMMDNLDRFDDSSADGFSQFGYDASFLPQQYWNGMSPSGVIF